MPVYINGQNNYYLWQWKKKITQFPKKKKDEFIRFDSVLWSKHDKYAKNIAAELIWFKMIKNSQYFPK